MKKKKYSSPWWIKLGFGVFALIFIAGAFIVVNTMMQNNKAAKTYDNLRNKIEESREATFDKIDFALLREENPEIAAWIKAEGTAIDYPVLRGEDNTYYLNHLYTGETNRMGSIFMDYRNDKAFKDKNTVIYGHNMQDGAMFNALGEYKSQEFYDAVPTMEIYTPEGEYVIELISGTVEDGNYEFVKFNFEDQGELNAYVKELKSRSTFKSSVEVGPDDKLISLCTCSYELFNGRYMLVGRLVPGD